MSDVTINVSLDEANDRVKAEVRRTIAALTLKLERMIKQDMLTGQRLNVQTGRLRGSVTSQVNEDQDSIEGVVGAGGALVRYAFIHEFGLNAVVSVKAHLREIKQAFGKPITPKQIMVGAFTRKVNARERRYMRDSLDEVGKIVPENIQAAIARGLAEE